MRSIESSGDTLVDSVPITVSFNRSTPDLYSTPNSTEEAIDWELLGRPFDRLNLAGRQRMYSQKMAKDAMLVYLGVKADIALWNLKDTRDKFMVVQDAQRKGNLFIGVKPTTESHMLAQLEVVDGVMIPFIAAVDSIVAKGYANKTEIDVVVANELQLLQNLNAFVGMVEKMNSRQTDQDGNPIESDGASEVSLAEILINSAINQAGAQRMRTQKMVYQYCKLLAGYEMDSARASLLSTVTMFDRVHIGLNQGDEELKLPVINDPLLLLWLRRIDVHWSRKNAVRELILQEPSLFHLSQILEPNLSLLGRYNVVVGLINLENSITMPPPPPAPLVPPSAATRLSSDAMVGMAVLIVIQVVMT
eukprot:CAMPEP_0114254344 /NCGR_PEP_ID=MMETSP0058-20121206/16926_1 /TAXON_ID=36894 /ORGANISM="Pyramimonas parkeae, CCMP726" /LENGTH=361 /DNA_ID=CAMNT_0001368551 /DNA_START=555 /DNA_END=1640 /DNA_ORIENTATION=+